MYRHSFLILVVVVTLLVGTSGCSFTPEPTGQEDLSGLTVNVYWAEWCGPCKQMKPTWERLASSYPNLEVKRTNVDANQQAAQRAGITSIPQAIVTFDGEEVGRIRGRQSYADVVYALVQCKVRAQ